MSDTTAEVRALADAPRDGTIIRLLIDWTGSDGWSPLTDAMKSWTIGGSSLDHTGEDFWQYVGWNWSQDCFGDLRTDDGAPMPIGWLPFEEATRTAPSASHVVEVRCKVCGDEPIAGAICKRFDCPALTLAAHPVTDTAKSAAEDVLAERERQKTVEGWTPEHDDDYAHFELARAASCYAAEAAEPTRRPAEEGDRPYNWPWHSDWWKPSGRRRNLVKAGALILAEIERLDRRAARDASKAEEGR